MNNEIFAPMIGKEVKSFCDKLIKDYTGVTVPGGSNLLFRAGTFYYMFGVLTIIFIFYGVIGLIFSVLYKIDARKAISLTQTGMPLGNLAVGAIEGVLYVIAGYVARKYCANVKYVNTCMYWEAFLYFGLFSYFV